jgi:hypothetical protein
MRQSQGLSSAHPVDQIENDKEGEAQCRERVGNRQYSQCYQPNISGEDCATDLRVAFPRLYSLLIEMFSMGLPNLLAT